MSACKYPLKIFKYGASGSCEECAICLEDMCSDSSHHTVCHLPCGHQFHDTCIEGIRSSNTIRHICPLCRADIPKDAKRLFKDGNLCYNSLNIRDHTLENELTFMEHSTLQLAIVNWLEAADLGHAGAMYNIALLCRRGFGMEQSDSDALEWLLKAALLGSAQAQTNLGYFNHHGIGTPINIKEAVKWYQLAAEQNNGDGMYNLGVMYQHGLGVPQDNEKAVDLYFRAHCHYCRPASEALLRQGKVPWMQVSGGLDVGATAPVHHPTNISQL